MFLFAQEAQETNFQYLVIQIPLERRDVRLDEALLVDIDESRCIVHGRCVDYRHIDAFFRDDLEGIKRLDIGGRKTERTTDCFAVYNATINLYQANKANMPKPEDPNLIHPGMKMKIPSLTGEYRKGTYDPKKSYSTYGE